MKISALEEYGLRCLVHLARRDQDAPVSAREVAAAEGLTVEYVTQLLVRLRRAGLVRSVRGSRGGFLLTVEAADPKFDPDGTRAYLESLGGKHVAVVEA